MKTDKREALSKMVGLTVDEQRLKEIEGWKRLMRFIDRIGALNHDDCAPSDLLLLAEQEGHRVWGAHFDA